MNEGYIKLYRQITDNPLWKEKPFTRGQAWVDLIMMANFKDETTYLKGQKVTIKRGQVLRSVEKLSTRWGWSDNKTRRFLAELTAEQMAEVVGRVYGTLITIENYETFQGEQRENGRANERANGRANGRPDGRGDKKEKKDKEIKKRERPTLADVSTYVDEMNYSMDPAAFFDYYEETGWMKKNGTPVRDWKAAARTWERREKQFAKSEQPKKPAQVEPPKYEEFEPDPEVKDAIPMPEEIRKKLRGAFS